MAVAAASAREISSVGRREPGRPAQLRVTYAYGGCGERRSEHFALLAGGQFQRALGRRGLRWDGPRGHYGRKV